VTLPGRVSLTKSSPCSGQRRPNGDLLAGKIVTHPSRARCSSCGNPRITAVCCNCASFVCGKHDNIADLSVARRTADSVFRRRLWGPGDVPAEALARIPDPDGAEEAEKGPPAATTNPDGDNAGTGVDGPDELLGEPAGAQSGVETKAVRQRHFCTECAPIGNQYDPHVVGALGMLTVGLVITLLNPPSGITIIALALGWFTLRVVGGVLRRRKRGSPNRKLLFLAPQIKKLELTESVAGQCILDPDRRATLRIKEVRGTIEAGLAWTRSDVVAARRYLRRIDPARRRLVRIEAGHLVLRGAGQPNLQPPAGCESDHPGCVTLRPWLADHDVLAGIDGRGDVRWNFTVAYKPEEPPEGWRLPVWVTPSFTPDSERRALDLRIQWRTTEPLDEPTDRPVLTVKELTRVVLYAPAAWGRPLRATFDKIEQTTVGRSADNATRVEWRKPEVATGTSRGSVLLSVLFARPIDPNATIAGEVVIAFAQPVSGTESVQVHAPGGGRRRDGARIKVKTTMTVRFDMSLVGIRHQQSRTVPDSTPDGPAESRRFPGKRPDQHLVAALVKLLSEQRYLVKSVVENPPRPGRGVGVQHRVWDITGRRYRGLYPIDFRITVTGDDAELSSAAPSTTSIRLVVRGVYATDTMDAEIGKAHEELWAKIDAVVKASDTGADGNSPRIEGEPLSASSEYAAHLKSALISLERVVDNVDSDGGISTDAARRMREIIDDGLSGGERG
jgi:hypothetical protein